MRDDHYYGDYAHGDCNLRLEKCTNFGLQKTGRAEIGLRDKCIAK